MMANKYKIIFVFSIILEMVISSCKKPNESTPSATFLKEFGNWTSPFFIESIVETTDQGYLMVGNNTNQTPVMIRVKKDGNLAWSKTMTNDTFLASYVTPAGNGTYVMNCLYKYQISKVDTMGNLLSSDQYFNFIDNYFGLSPAISSSNGYIISSTNGWHQGGTSINYIILFDKTPNYVDTIRIADYPTLVGKTLTFNVYQEGPSNSYYVYGQKLTKKLWSWNDNIYLYAAKVAPHKGWLINVIDGTDESSTFSAIAKVTTSDSGLVLLAQRINYAGNNSSAFVVSLDKNLKINWQNNYLESGSTINPSSISPCSDGGYIISGKDSIGTNSTKPFAVKIDKNGNQQWSKIYTFPGSGQFNSGIELSEGGYIFAGSTVGFGNGKSNQTLLLKTDANGNY